MLLVIPYLSIQLFQVKMEQRHFDALLYNFVGPPIVFVEPLLSFDELLGFCLPCSQQSVQLYEDDPIPVYLYYMEHN